MNSADVIAFTRGDCHVLAAALNRRTGWPIYAFSDRVNDPSYHAFVLLPDGRALDVLGVRSVEMVRAWVRSHPGGANAGPAVATDWPTLRELWGATVKSTYAPVRARRVADELLAMVAA